LKTAVIRFAGKKTLMDIWFHVLSSVRVEGRQAAESR